MKASIVVASRYTSTIQGGQWIAERLAIEGWDTALHPAEQAPAPTDEDLVILGSGLYAHKALPALDAYIDAHLEALLARKLAMFALAMRASPIFVRGQAHGGLSQLQPYFEKLKPALIHADMLPGQMVYSQMSDEDKAGLDRFYEMLKLPAEEVAKRKAPRTMMSKSDYWEFAETAMKKGRETTE